MTYYFVSALAGALALLGALFLANEECAGRYRSYEQRLHTKLVLYDAEGGNQDLSYTLYSTSNVLGRRKRRSDICLACYEDGNISRNHALLSYDGENIWIKPIFRWKHMCYTEVYVENELVPPEGRILHYGDRIAISGHLMQLHNTRDWNAG